MKNFLKNIFNYKKKVTVKENLFLKTSQKTKVNKIFEAISDYNEFSEVRYVGGCVRKILSNEVVDDIDLATNINPEEVKLCLKIKNINFYETGLSHGTITAKIEKNNFEITSLRKDLSTDGRHAVVEFTNNWTEDSKRRDFTFNSIYADKDGNIFDPNDDTKDLKNGFVNFIGNPEDRIKEDYLRILRYIRFYINYSKEDHKLDVIRSIKKNINGITTLSKERLIDELKKLVLSNSFINLPKDKFCKEIILTIFPQIINLDIFKKLNKYSQNIIKNKDFVFLLSLLIIDNTDNSNYFLFKYNFSKNDQKRINFLKDNFNLSPKERFSKKKLNNILFYYGKLYLIDMIDFELFRSQKSNKKLIEIKNYYQDKEIPTFPLKTANIMEKYNLKEGAYLGRKLKELENLWIENNFKISEREINKILLS